ncbi:hypothetical protein DA2_0671 [Desulfovibrio sp. A2]|nr:hypothetical protein DA2_0671 [Desulfovibrio sp. A2]
MSPEAAERALKNRLCELRGQHYCWEKGQSGARAFLCWNQHAERAWSILFEARDDEGFGIAELYMRRDAIHRDYCDEQYPGELSDLYLALAIFYCLPA